MKMMILILLGILELTACAPNANTPLSASAGGSSISASGNQVHYPSNFPASEPVPAGCPLASVTTGVKWTCMVGGVAVLPIEFLPDGSAIQNYTPLFGEQSGLPTCETNLFSEQGNGEYTLVYSITNVVQVGGNLSSMTVNGAAYNSCSSN